LELAVLLARRWFPGAVPWDIENQAGAMLLDKRETERLQRAVQNAIVRAIRIK